MSRSLMTDTNTLQVLERALRNTPNGYQQELADMLEVTQARVSQYSKGAAIPPTIFKALLRIAAYPEADQKKLLQAHTDRYEKRQAEVRRRAKEKVMGRDSPDQHPGSGIRTLTQNT